MRLAAIGLALGAMLQAAVHVAPEPKDFRFERVVQVEAGGATSNPGRTCAVLGGSIFAHAKPALADLRLFAGGAEVPYAVVTMSETAPSAETADILNLGMQHGHLVFDLRMPARAYTTVDLVLALTDFVATAQVTGLESLTDKSGTALGSFTLFDLSDQKLGRSTALPLSESTFPFLHVEIAAYDKLGKPSSGMTDAALTSASVPPSREAQTIYTTIAETATIVQRGRESVATFEIPAHVPVERVSFTLAAGDKTNFSRTVLLRAKAAKPARDVAQADAMSEELGGEISRVRITEAGREIHQESLAVAGTLGSNGQATAKVEVAVENGDDRPLAIASVRIEMRERKVCFDTPAQPLTMYYGDDRLEAPVYDFSRLFSTAETAGSGRLEAEVANPVYVVRVEHKTLLERYPQIVWVALLGVVGVLGFVAFRSAKRV